MSIMPEYIVVLWLVPVILHFVLPVLSLPLIMLLEKRAPVFAAQSTSQRKAGLHAPIFAAADDKRAFPRERLDGIVAQVSDGMRCCRGKITDISASGICLVSPKGSLDQNARTLGVLLTGSGDSIHMQVKPRWNMDSGADLNIGASIERTLGNWNFMTKGSEEERFASAS